MLPSTGLCAAICRTLKSYKEEDVIRVKVVTIGDEHRKLKISIFTDIL